MESKKVALWSLRMGEANINLSQGRNALIPSSNNPIYKRMNTQQIYSSLSNFQLQFKACQVV